MPYRHRSRNAPSIRVQQAFILAAAGTLISAPLPAQERVTLPILDAVTLTASCDYVLQDARGRAAELEALPLVDADVRTVLDRWDHDAVLRENVTGPVAILNNVHPDRTVRDAADACRRQVSAFSTQLYQNEALYQRIVAVEPVDEVTAKFREDLLRYFEDSGVNLPPERRARAREIADRLTALQQEFERNLRDDTTRLVFTPEEYRGLPEGFLRNARRDAAGNIVLGMETAEYQTFMRNALDREARRRYYMAFLNVGAPRNIEILGEISSLRRELAALHDQPSFAHHVIRRLMAGTPEAVATFLAEVEAAVAEVERTELEEIRHHKSELSGEPLDRVRLERWDVAFYRERLREHRYSVDQEELRRYFPTEETLQWSLQMSGRLFGVLFEEAQVPTWHPSVRYFDVTDERTDEFLGGLYVDLYPREGKYGHAAVWPVRRGSSQLDRRPISVLVTNFDRRGLTHNDVRTLLHELGHALHGIFSETRYSMRAGTTVEGDFVEAPSQMYEEWGRRPETLATIAEFCPECPILTPEQVERLEAARRFGQAMAYADQRLLATLDQALTGTDPVEVMAAWMELEELTPLGSVHGAHFPARFGHLANHYGARYYGYMWSQVIALDMLSAFGDDLMDPRVGRRFREVVLARGGERPSMRNVEEFLGRPVSSDAFFQEITGGER
jgi:thimet oligopeptidase